LRVDFTEKQRDAFLALNDLSVREVLFGGAKGPGKATSLDAVLFTPQGFKSMRDIRLGDLVSSPDGAYSPVIAIHPQGIQRLYRVKFIDGASVLATAEHLWYAKIVGRKNKRNQEWSIFTTQELMVLLEKAKKSKLSITPNILIPLTKPVQFTPITNKYVVRHKIDPYVLGVLIGDGCLLSSSISFTSNDNEIVEQVRKKYPVTKYKSKYTYGISDGGKLKKDLEFYGLMGHRSETKFIPEQYKISDISVRRSILQGLLDTDGYIDKNGCIEFTSVSKQLAEDVQWVVRSLGGKATISTKVGSYKNELGEKIECQLVYRLYINIPDESIFFRLSRKAHRGNISYNGGNGNLCRRLTSIVYEKDDLAQCITIRNPSGLYLTDDFIVTHNSWFLCVWSYIWAKAIADKFGLKKSRNPPHIGFLGRKQGIDFTRTTLARFRDVIPSENYIIRGGSEKEVSHILIEGRVAVDFGGLDSQQAISKFNSAEYAFAAIDQAEETTESDLRDLRGALRLCIKGKPLNYKILFTANPANCWLKQSFIGKDISPDRRFVQALPMDNPHLPPDYINTLKAAYEHRPEILRAYLYGHWDELDGIDQCIKSGWLEIAWANQYVDEWSRVFLSVDVARYGNDETVILLMDNGDIKEKKFYGQKGIDETANIIHVMSVENNKCPVALDDVEPYCGAVADILKRMGTPIIGCPAAGSPTIERNEERFYNLRAQMWWEAGKKLANGEISLKDKDPILQRQLTGVKYKYRNGKILIESKEEIKERLGESPDRGDAYVQALYAMDKVQKFRRGTTGVLSEGSSELLKFRQLNKEYLRPIAV
jgi:hypothetical protein